MSLPPNTVVWIVEDDLAYGESVAECIGTTPDGPRGAAEAVMNFESVEDALARIDSYQDRSPDARWPDVILLDVNLPGMTGIEGIDRLKCRLPDSAIIMHTIRDDPQSIFAALGAGASGYLLKGATPDVIVETVGKACDGQMLMGPEVAERVLSAFEAHRPAPDYGLTSRETDVLRELVEGHSQPQIAERLYVSPSTVNSHVQSIYAKLHVHTGSACVSKAIRERLVPSAGEKH